MKYIFIIGFYATNILGCNSQINKNLSQCCPDDNLLYSFFGNNKLDKKSIFKDAKNVFYLAQLESDSLLDLTNSIDSIKSIELIDATLNLKRKYNYDIDFFVVTFKDINQAKSIFEVMKYAQLNNAKYEQPPKMFFLINRKLYYFCASENRTGKRLFSIREKLIAEFFNQEEVKRSTDN